MIASVHSFGCEQRHLDARRVEALMVANGATLAEDAACADVIVVITCAVDRRNEEVSVNALRRFVHQKQAFSELVVGGCLPSISPGRLEALPVAFTFSPRTLEKLEGLWGPTLQVPLAAIGDANNPVIDSSVDRTTTPASPRELYDRAKRGFTIRLNHGCLLTCSYCVIRFATGRLKSVTQESVKGQFREAIRRSAPTVMLVGGDTGAYGRDLGSNLPQLLQQLLRLDGAPRVFVHDLNANWFVHDFQSYACLLRNDCSRLQAFCIPVQSGSDRVLRLMRRPYKIADVIRSLKITRTLAPHLLLGTHIIVGFPGETEQDFAQTLALLHEFPFDFVSCFRYSEHASATAAKLGPKISENVIALRLECLRTMLGPSATILT